MLLDHVSLHVMFPVVKLAAVLARKVLQLHVDPLPVALEVALALGQVTDKLGGAGRTFAVFESGDGWVWREVGIKP